jgi:hypothetical protein
MSSSDDDDDGEKPPEKNKKNYPIGYRRPPTEYRFKAGQRSANPKGRPKRNRAFIQAIEKTLMTPVPMVVNGKKVHRTLGEMTLQQMANKAVKGDVAAARMVIQLFEKASPLVAPETDPREKAHKEALAAKLIDLLDRAADEKRTEKIRTKDESSDPNDLPAPDDNAAEDPAEE